MDDIGIHVTSANTEDASLIAGVIGDALTSAGFSNVDIEQSMTSQESGVTLSVLREVAPHLFIAPISVTYGPVEFE